MATHHNLWIPVACSKVLVTGMFLGLSFAYLSHRLCCYEKCTSSTMIIWLVVWIFFAYIGNFIIPTDVHIFQRGGPTTTIGPCFLCSLVMGHATGPTSDLGSLGSRATAGDGPGRPQIPMLPEGRHGHLARSETT